MLKVLGIFFSVLYWKLFFILNYLGSMIFILIVFMFWLLLRVLKWMFEDLVYF